MAPKKGGKDGKKGDKKDKGGGGSEEMTEKELLEQAKRDEDERIDTLLAAASDAQRR